MRFKRHNKLERGLESINMAPLIDVIFQLLIFFMLSSSFTFPSGINVKLPKAVTSDVIKEDNVVISISSENILYLNNAVITVKELGAYLKKMPDKQQPILLKADRRSSVGRIVDVWDLCRSIGVENINIATNQDQ